MPRRASGNPPLKALAVKLPSLLIEEVRRYADLRGMTISAVIREGLDMRLHGSALSSEYNGNTALPMTTTLMLTRLASTLTTAVDQLRRVYADAVVPEGEEQQHAAALQSDDSNTVSHTDEYNGNTLHKAPGTAPKQEPPDVSPPSEACPDFDPTKYVLGKLCPQRHVWGTTGQSLLSLPSRTCKECRNASKRQKRAEKRQTTPPMA
jgi:hypothetical protein